MSYEMRMWDPRDLQDVIELASSRKDEQLMMTKGGGTTWTRPSVNMSTPRSPPKSATEKARTCKFKLFEYEISRRRAAGLCFTCDEKYNFNHISKNPKALILTTAEEPEDQKRSQTKTTSSTLTC